MSRRNLSYNFIKVETLEQNKRFVERSMIKIIKVNRGINKGWSQYGLNSHGNAGIQVEAVEELRDRRLTG